MKITDILPQIKTDNRVQARKIRETEAVKAVSPAAAGLVDRVEISSGTKDVQRMQQILKETPAVRMEKIEALKQEIAQGRYNIDPLEVADKMLVSLVTENPLDK